MAINQIFAKGIKLDANFTGTAFVNFLIQDINGIYNCQIYDVLFEAGCRNDWHSHPGGQILLCTDGIGYCKEKDKPARQLTKGDVVEIQPDVVHWHGAAPNSAFSHIGVSPNTHKGQALWLGAVTDEEYNSAVKEK